MKDIKPAAGPVRSGDPMPAPMTDDGWQSADMAPPGGPLEEATAHEQSPTPEMQEFDISYDGRSYQYNGYCYDALADAVGYAKLMRSQPTHDNSVGPSVPRAKVTMPSAADLELMSALGISFEAGRYLFGTFRYDRLVDAVSYAQSR